MWSATVWTLLKYKILGLDRDFRSRLFRFFAYLTSTNCRRITYIQLHHDFSYCAMRLVYLLLRASLAAAGAANISDMAQNAPEPTNIWSISGIRAMSATQAP